MIIGRKKRIILLYIRDKEIQFFRSNCGQIFLEQGDVTLAMERIIACWTRIYVLMFSRRRIFSHWYFLQIIFDLMECIKLRIPQRKTLTTLPTIQTQLPDTLVEQAKTTWSYNVLFCISSSKVYWLCSPLSYVNNAWLSPQLRSVTHEHYDVNIMVISHHHTSSVTYSN